MTTPAHPQESRALQKLLDAAEAVALYKLIDAIALAKAPREIF